MSKKPVIAANSQGDLTAHDYREFAETFRAAATLQRHALNLALNKPVPKCLPTKEEYEKFLSYADYLQKKFFEYYKEYSECASIMEKNQSASAKSATN